MLLWYSTMLRIHQYSNNKWLLFLFFSILVVSLKSSILNTPHYWDSLNRIHNANWIKEHSFNPFLEKDEGMLNAQGRPPFFLELLAVSFSLFGHSLIVSHLIVVLFSAMGVIFTFLLAEMLFSRRVGIISSLFLLFSPLYFAQSGIVNYAVPLTALSIMTIFFALRENVICYLVCASSLVLTKETGMLILFPILLAILLRYYGRPKLRRTLLIYTSPFLFYLLWLLACKIYLGWFQYPSHLAISNFADTPRLFKTFLDRATQLIFQNTRHYPSGHLYYPDSASEFFLQSYHLILSVVILLSIKTWIDFIRRNIIGGITIFGGISVYLIFFSLYPMGLDRYLLPIYPLFYILSSKSMDTIFKGNSKLLLIASLLIISVFVTNWTGTRSVFGYQLETNMEYLDFIHVHQEAAKFIEKNHPRKHVLTDWPQTMELKYPFEGYVTKPIVTSAVSEQYNPHDIDLIYFVPHCSKQLRDFVMHHDLVLLARFESNAKVAQIYQLLRHNSST